MMFKSNKTKHRSFKHTLLILVWSCVSIPLLILTVYQVRDDYQKTIERSNLDLEHETERTTLLLSQKIRQVISDLDYVASDGAVIRSLSMPILSPESVKRLRELLGNNSSVASIQLIDRELFPVEVLPSWALKEDNSAYKPMMSEVVVSPKSIIDPRPRLFTPLFEHEKEPYLIFIRPILKANHSLTKPFEVAGILFAKVSINRLLESVSAGEITNRQLKLYSAKSLLLEKGDIPKVEHHKVHSRNLSLGIENDSLLLSITSSNQGVLDKVLLSFQTQAIIVLAFISLMFIATKRFANNITHPLITLSKLTERMSSRDFESNSSEEIDTENINYSEFQKAFQLLRTMESTIGDQFRQLQEANRNLEDKVALRTEELEENLALLDRKRAALQKLVQFSLDVQLIGSIEESCKRALDIAKDVCDYPIAIVIHRSNYFHGYNDMSSLHYENKHYLSSHDADTRAYPNFLAFKNQSSWLKFFTIGSSELSYQGYFVYEPSDEQSQADELLQILCTLLSSALKQYKLTEKLHRLAHVDSLTGLANRHYFNTRYNELTSKFTRNNPQSHFGIFVIDVNGLKRVNDQFGHHCGDEMLITVANEIKSLARGNDTLARVGGDEFYLLLEAANAEICESFAMRLQEKSASLSMRIEDQDYKISYSFGFATTQNDPIQDLLKLADKRMYDLKQAHYKKHLGPIDTN